MGCDKYLELLSARLDGVLTRDEERELEIHLSGCPECQALADQLGQLRAGLAGLEDIEAPEGFSKRVMEQIKAEQKAISLFRRPQFKALAGLAACLVLVVGLYGVSHPKMQNADETFTLARSFQPDAFGRDLDEAELIAPYSDTDSPAVSDAEPDFLAPAERLSAHAILILERMPQGAEELIPPDTTVTYDPATGEEGYRWTTDGEPEALAQIERLAQEQGLTAERSSAPAEEAQYHLVILSGSDQK